MKISVIITILVPWFYGYIEVISVEKNIGRPNIDQNSWQCKKNLIQIWLKIQ